jgi:exopolysaccharide/PEP-CTERM locus tyrosine autokinase
MLEKALEKSKKTETTDSIKGVEPPQEQRNESATDKQASIQNKQNIVKFDWDYLNENGFIRIDDSHSRIAEEYRSIKRPLVANALGERKRDIKNANLILVTSSVPGEGKTFTSINLAFSIAAEMDKKVLLIDADVAKPSVSKVLGIKSKFGLIDYLEKDSLELSDIILQTEIPGLRIITAGKTHKYSTELLASDKMIALSKELSERYADRIVIFDTPPLLATTQAEVLAGQMGQVILVVGAEITSQSFVMESVKKLQSCSDVVLAILNKAQRNLNAGYYGYGYY